MSIFDPSGRFEAMNVTPITAVPVRNQRLLVRADLNVPIEEGRITDDTRIRRFADSLKTLLADGARVVVVSHLGRPGGQVDPDLTMRRLAGPLRKHLKARVAFVDDLCGQEARDKAAAVKPGEVLLLENLRFEPGEEQNDPAFARQLAELGDMFVNDAFSVSHREHASTSAITQIMPSYAGPLMLAEMAALRTALDQPQSPSVGIVGGRRLSDKVGILSNLAGRMDTLLLGGGLANTFLLADGVRIGRSECEPDMVTTAAEIHAIARASGCQILLPTDIVYAYRLEEKARNFVADLNECPEDAMIMDVGPATTRRYRSVMADAQTILWNGPLGVCEMTPFDQSTRVMAVEAAELTRADLAITVAGGRNTVSALSHAGVTDDLSFVSTARAAFAEWLEGRPLPGIQALSAHATA